MRDLVLFTVVVGSLPFILWRPYIGILMWTWLAYMNPHRLTWSYAYDIPFAQIVGLATLGAFLFDKDKRGVPLNATTCIWLMFVMWFGLTTIFALNIEASIPSLQKAAKIQLFAFLTLMLIRDKRQIHLLLWVMVVSLGFYGTKGGLWVLTTGGTGRVWGPPGSFLADNNALALALIMTIPLMWYLLSTLKVQWQRFLMMVAMGLTGLSILGSHSRGAVLAGICMLLFLVLKAQKRSGLLIAILLFIPIGITFMPEEWSERMDTIRTYEEDNSAYGRILAWKFAIDVANKRPVVGGGFEVFVEENYRRFSPEVSEVIEQRDGRYQGSHSIYFRVLGEHGYIGLGLFLLLGVSAYRRASSIQATRSKDDTADWSGNLASMLQVSMVGYATAGAFQGLSYFDLYYNIIGLIVILDRYVKETVTEDAAAGALISAGGQPLRGNKT